MGYGLHSHIKSQVTSTDKVGVFMGVHSVRVYTQFLGFVRTGDIVAKYNKQYQKVPKTQIYSTKMTMKTIDKGIY